MVRGKQQQKKRKKKLTAKDFCGDGEPYTEVVVTISIRILGAGITRSRLAVNVYSDPALEPMAREVLERAGIESYGYNEDGVFGTCLSENFNGWEDMDKSWPRIDENYDGRGLEPREAEYLRDSARDMNAYIAKSVEWALALHRRGMNEAENETKRSSGGEPVM